MKNSKQLLFEGFKKKNSTQDCIDESFRLMDLEEEWIKKNMPELAKLPYIVDRELALGNIIKMKEREKNER